MSVSILKIIAILLGIACISFQKQGNQEQRDGCQKCYKKQIDQECPMNSTHSLIQVFVSFEPLFQQIGEYPLDLFYDKSKNTNPIIEQFYDENEISSAVQIFNSMLNILQESRKLRLTGKKEFQKSQRSFVISQLYFFKKWWSNLSQAKQNLMRQITATKYFEILNGGISQTINRLSSYDDIIENYQNGLIFLQKQLRYIPKIASISGKIQNFQLFFLNQIGFQGILTRNSNRRGLYYLESDIKKDEKFQILCFESVKKDQIDQLLKYHDDVNYLKDLCLIKEDLLDQAREEFIALSSEAQTGILSYLFGGKFKKGSSYSYNVIEVMMNQFSMDKCSKIISIYQNPTAFFKRAISEVIQKDKKIQKWKLAQSQGGQSLNQMKMQIIFRGVLRKGTLFLQDMNKFFILLKLSSSIQPTLEKTFINQLNSFSDFTLFLQRSNPYQHSNQLHLQYYLNQTILLQQKMHALTAILNESFALVFSSQRSPTLFYCNSNTVCQIPPNSTARISLRFMYTGVDHHINTTNMFKIGLPENEFYEPQDAYLHYHQIICICPYPMQCKCYLFIQITEYSYGEIKLIKKRSANVSLFDGSRQTTIKQIKNYRFSHSQSKFWIIDQSGHFVTISANDGDMKQIELGFETIIQTKKNTYFLLVTKPYYSLVLITISEKDPQIIAVQVIHSDIQKEIFLQFSSQIINNNTLFIDQNGFFIKNVNVDGYQPVSEFVYIEDERAKISVNVLQPSILKSSMSGSFSLLSINPKAFLANSSHSNSKFILSINNSNHEQRLIQLSNQKNIYLLSNQLPASPIPSQKAQFPYDPRYIQEWKNIINETGYVKYSFKMYDKDSILLRLDNLHDKEDATVGLFIGNVSAYLALFYGIAVEFQQIKELSIGGNMQLQSMWDNKLNWNLNKTKMTSILKETITLKSLEIRLFLLKNVKFASNCKSTHQISRSKVYLEAKFDQQKSEFPKYDSYLLDNMKEYLFQRDHCKQISPVLLQDQGSYGRKRKDQHQSKFEMPWNKVEKQIKKSESHSKQHLTKQTCNSPPCQKQKKSKDPTDESHQTYEMIKQKILKKQKIERSQKRIYFMNRKKQLKQLYNQKLKGLSIHKKRTIIANVLFNFSY